MKKKVPSKLKGFRDFLPLEKRQRDFIKKIIEKTFVLHGFLPIETPTLESASLLLGKYGDEADRLVYVFEDKGKRKVGLRYDQTVPTARFLANYKDKLPAYFKRYQTQSVFRAEKPQKGRYRELLQCDIDIFGSNSPVADAEILACTYDVFKNIGFNGVKFLVNDRLTLINLLTPFATEKVDVFSIIQSIDKLDKQTKEAVIAELEKKGLSKSVTEECLVSVFSGKPTDSLSKIIDLAVKLGVPRENIVFTPFLARGLDYYTGMIFEAKLEGDRGSLCGGGRYDGLIEQLSGISIPAVGVGLGFDRIVEKAVELNLVNSSYDNNILVTVFSEEYLPQSLEITKKLRELNLISDIYVGKIAGIGKQFKYANKEGYDYVVVIGENEVKTNSVVIKNMKTEEQITLKVSDLKIWASKLTN